MIYITKSTKYGHVNVSFGIILLYCQYDLTSNNEDDAKSMKSDRRKTKKIMIKNFSHIFGLIKRENLKKPPL